MTDEAKALVDAVDRYVRVYTTGSSDGAKYRARKNLMDLIETQAREIERLTLTVRKLQGNQAALEAELAKFKALAETLAGALGEIAQPDYGYTDILERGCPPEKHIDYFCSMVTWRQRTAREALTSYKEARDAS